MSSLKEKFREIKKFPQWIYWLPARILQLVLHVLYRIEIVDPENHHLTAAGKVGVAWHNRLMFFAAIFPKQTRLRSVAVVSASRDGQYIADLIRQFGLLSLRGSSSKKGAHAMREAISAVREGKNVIFTPDGPRGPKYGMKNGPVMLSSLTGAPIVPISVNASRFWQIKSWDNFQIPKPFCKLTLRLGTGMYVPPDLDENGLEEWRAKAERALLEITVD